MYDIEVKVINKALNTSYTADDLTLDIKNNTLIEKSSGNEIALPHEVLAEIAKEKRREHFRIFSNYDS